MWLYAFIFVLLGAAIAVQVAFLKTYYTKVGTVARGVMVANIVLLTVLAGALAYLLVAGRV